MTRRENCPCWMSLLSERTGPTALPHLQVCCCTAAFRCCRRCNLHQWLGAVKSLGKIDYILQKGSLIAGVIGLGMIMVQASQVSIEFKCKSFTTSKKNIKKQWSVQFHLLDVSQGVNWGCLCAERKTPRPGAIWQILGSSASSKVNCEWLLMMSGRPFLWNLTWFIVVVSLHDSSAATSQRFLKEWPTEGTNQGTA